LIAYCLQWELESARDLRIRRCTKLRNGATNQDLDVGFLLRGGGQITVVRDNDWEVRSSLLCLDQLNGECRPGWQYLTLAPHDLALTAPWCHLVVIPEMGPPEIARLKSGRSPASETGREPLALGSFAREGFAQFTRSSRNVPIRSYRIEQRGAPRTGRRRSRPVTLPIASRRSVIASASLSSLRALWDARGAP